MTPTTLLERVADGDMSAVATCIDTYSGLVWSLARRFLNVEADAEDAVQEIFMELWSTAARFDPGRSAESTYVAMIARRRLIDRLRKSYREPDTAPWQDVEQQIARDGHLALEASSESASVIRIIDSMQPEQQQVLRMSAWLGMSHAAIAERTSLPIGTVKSHLRRGLLAIREQLGVDGAAS